MSEYDLEDGWERFCKQFDDGVCACANKKQAMRMSIRFVDCPHPVNVDIYSESGDIDKPSRIVTNAVSIKAGEWLPCEQMQAEHRARIRKLWWQVPVLVGLLAAAWWLR